MAGIVDTGLSRRTLVKAGAAIGAAALASPSLIAATRRETPVTRLFHSLSAEQRKVIAFPFDHPLRQKVDNFWSVSPMSVDSFSAGQQELVRQIFLDLHHPDHAEMVMRQVAEDNGPRGFGQSSIAFFGEPGGRFEFVLTGGHCTRRCDGTMSAGSGFAGPIFYGHSKMGPAGGKANHDGNAWWYQARQANRLFAMLDGKQRALALVDSDRGEHGTETVKLTGRKTGLAGIPMGELSRDQKAEVRKTLKTLLEPFRQADADAAWKMAEANGLDHLHLAFFRSGDVASDQGWNIWQIEGPSMLWYFRGVPHVHTWVNIQKSFVA